MSGLAATGLTCIKRDRVLFDSLSFSLQPGQLIYLRGPNGAGKTSLLRILTGLSQPDAGDISYCGRPLSYKFFHNLIYLGHKLGLSMAFNALENLSFWCAQHQTPVQAPVLYDVLNELGLVGLEDVPVKYLSAGQQRRVALARLWLKPAKFWIMDEPFTALDTKGVALIEEVFAKHINSGGAILTTSHQALSPRAGEVTLFDLEYQL
ncbi:cytochrome c biogenesis heme-transporting ATPase CcmA [Alteromonas pelagimontana]|uniref:Cytochrome c biogenesis heme-transporting ATPase CcmA n=1 Tax=Alteromonas pelagimontana TaxID=1858656 RepID=A0A6M4MF73_9ALTE|nr:cytochrome c biogenesis heme-transporting ATPase CcmA [Alteromonas pelagimontana]QJR81733.1 cytochrome c biogenesis heme-transporting ATPase CcmA [Alteromonas pelagimontana]